MEPSLFDTEIGQIFHSWSVVKYTGYNSLSKKTDWCSLIRQKINNLYTRYFDKEVILQRDYLEMLSTPKQLYFQWINGRELTAARLTAAIQDAMTQAERLKTTYQNQKMELSWADYTQVIEGFLEKIFRTCKPPEECEASYQTIYDFINEDNYYIRYFCRSLEGELMKWQKQYYGIREHKRYRRCMDCNSLFELHTSNQKRCVSCQKIHTRQIKTEKQRRYRVEKLKS